MEEKEGKKGRQVCAEYRKNMEYSELILTKEKQACYEEKMLHENPISGILPFRSCEKADKYAYDITGKKNMSLVFARVPMNAKQIRTILKHIFEILTKSKEYLLKEDSFLLLPDFIFTNFPDYEVELCYYPEYAVPVKEQLERFLEILLNVVDYKEQEAVELVYGLYHKIREETVQLQEIVSILEKKEDSFQSIYKKPDSFSHIQEQEKEEKQISKKRQNFFQNWLEQWKQRKQEKKEYDIQQVFVCEEIPEYAADQKTQVISVSKATIPNLYAEATGEHIFLEKVPFYIGCLTEYVDYAIQADGISRFHAKIECREERYYITDLNSTNGTLLNGCLLNAHEPEELHTGDTIQFAYQNYIFLA